MWTMQPLGPTKLVLQVSPGPAVPSVSFGSRKPTCSEHLPLGGKPVNESPSCALPPATVGLPHCGWR